MMEQQHTTDELQALKAPMALLRERLHKEDIVSLDQYASPLPNWPVACAQGGGRWPYGC